MAKFLSRARVDQLLDSLKDDQDVAEKRAATLKLLIAEEDRFSRDLEQLELAFSRTGRGRAHVEEIKRIRDRFAPNSQARRQAERLLAASDETQKLLEACCEGLRLRYLQSGLSAAPPKRALARSLHRVSGLAQGAKVVKIMQAVTTPADTGANDE